MKKISNLSKRTKIIIASCISAFCVAVPVSLIVVSLSSNSGNFVFGNYSSYMAPDVEDILTKKYGVSFDLYENSDSIAYNFKKNNMDIAVSTSYETISLVKNNLLKKLDWPSINENISDANQALSYFTPSVQKILTNSDIDGDGNNDNLLEYSIPYFIQDLVFVYRGDKGTIQENSSWTEVFDFIRSDARFNANKSNSRVPLLGLIDDSRTLFSLSKIINNDQDINPADDDSIGNLIDDYNPLLDYLKPFGDKSALFSDSNTLLNKIANNELNGAVIYNGDGIYSAFGGDDEISISSETFHIVKPTKTLVALDTIVINNKISNNNLENAYSFLGDLCVNFDQSIYENQLCFLNFNYVNYTPALNSLYEFIKNNNYFSGPMSSKLLELYEINNVTYLEQPISNLMKSNLSFAYISFKQNL